MTRKGPALTTPPPCRFGPVVIVRLRPGPPGLVRPGLGAFGLGGPSLAVADDFKSARNDSGPLDSCSELHGAWARVAITRGIAPVALSW